MKYNYNNPKWVSKRSEVFKRDNYKCRACDSKLNIQCHHSYYVVNRQLWEYPLESFLTLCDNCHGEYHEKIKGRDIVIRSKKDVADKIKEENELGYFYTPTYQKPKSKQPKPKKKKFNKRKNKSLEINLNLPETIAQRRKRLIVPQWKIDEYRRNKV